MPALSAETLAANGTDFASWRQCEVHTRSTFNILSLCLSTLIICVWNAVHPDVPYPCAPRWRVYLERFIAFLIGLLLPEVLVLTALDQFMDARGLLQKVNGAQPVYWSKISYWTTLLKEMHPLVLTIPYWTEDWQPSVATESDGTQWTMTRAFYAVTRGFIAKSIDQASNPKRVTWLSANEIVALREVDSMRPLFAADGIDDHSKAGAIAKALFCWQLLVFAVNCIARRTEHLPLSLLEITTLAHSLCGLAAFALWWNKPHSVNEVAVVPIEGPLEKKIEWNKPYPTGRTVRGFGIFLYQEGEKLTTAVLSSLVVAALYGLPHLLALSTEFPTLAERRCWQVATAIIIGTPVFLVPLGWVLLRDRETKPTRITAFPAVIGLYVVYLIASCFIIAESFRQLSALPSGAFLAPALVCYLPHFS